MSDINQVIITGNVGKEPQIFTNEQGTIARFSVASTENYKAGEEWKERTQWTQIAVYDKFKAESVAKNLHKGSAVLIQGQLDSHSYEKDGETRYVTEVALRPGKSLLRLLDVKPKDQTAQKPKTGAAAAAAGKRPPQSVKTQPTT